MTCMKFLVGFSNNLNVSQLSHHIQIQLSELLQFYNYKIDYRTKTTFNFVFQVALEYKLEESR